MEYIIATPRFWLREFSPEDAQAFFELNLDPEVVKYTGDAPFDSIAAARDFLRSYSDYRDHGMGRWAVIDKSTSSYVGWCGLKRHADTGETDIGFRFFRKYWGQGYATESARACLEYGFHTLRIDTIIGRCMSQNVGSVRVLQKIGMQFQRHFDFEGKPGKLFSLNSQLFSSM